MAICGVCKNTSNEESDVKCSGSCGYVFHIGCIKGEWETKTRSKKEYRCKDCRTSSSQSSQKSTSSNSEVLTKECLVRLLESFKLEVFKEITSFKAEINDLSTSVQFMSDKMDTSCKLMEQLTTKFDQLKKENEEIKSKNSILTKEVNELKEKVKNLEQYSRANNIEINGVPITKQENINELLYDLGAAIGVEVRDSGISTAHRVPSYRKDRDPAIIVQFISRSKREDWITKYRQKRTLMADQINQRFPKQRVYINDHLTPENKQLLSKLKMKCREIGYTYAWCRDSKIFARKATGEPVKRITCLEDVERLA